MNTTHNALELYEIHVKESLSSFVCLVFFVFVSFLFCSLFYYYYYFILFFLRITKKRSIILRREVNHNICKEYRSAVIVVGHVELIRIPQ